MSYIEPCNELRPSSSSVGEPPFKKPFSSRPPPLYIPAPIVSFSKQYLTPPPSSLPPPLTFGSQIQDSWNLRSHPNPLVEPLTFSSINHPVLNDFCNLPCVQDFEPKLAFPSLRQLMRKVEE
ncbi:hypothetical protein HMI54_006396 [Coelomomyces lativittatus]|nr:hypothetical protein HMI54_006396 [Coelomomyces lativittatus]KAJ1515336.1 hypothetical protein HMI56_005652 [Coelomomyces lativittatus]KAJ1515452.1 hypothetical protein HMI55_003692 [Coelomomyces lativittatus]